MVGRRRTAICRFGLSVGAMGILTAAIDTASACGAYFGRRQQMESTTATAGATKG